MSCPSESDMMLKELQNSDLMYVNLMTDVFKIMVKCRWEVIANYRYLLPSGNRDLLNNSSTKNFIKLFILNHFM